MQEVHADARASLHDRLPHRRFAAAVTVLSLHHARGVGVVLDKVCSLLRPGGGLVVDEFRKEHLADEATAASFYYQHISLLCTGRKGSGGGGHPPMGDSFESWFFRLSEHRASIRGEGDVLAALEERFATCSLSYGPFLFRQGLDAEVEPLGRKLIEEGGILPSGLRWVGVLRAEDDGKGG